MFKKILLMIIFTMAIMGCTAEDIDITFGEMQIGELLKEEKHVIGGLVERITARTIMETEHTSYV